MRRRDQIRLTPIRLQRSDPTREVSRLKGGCKMVQIIQIKMLDLASLIQIKHRENLKLVNIR